MVRDSAQPKRKADGDAVGSWDVGTLDSEGPSVARDATQIPTQQPASTSAVREEEQGRGPASIVPATGAPSTSSLSGSGQALVEWEAGASKGGSALGATPVSGGGEGGMIPWDGGIDTEGPEAEGSARGPERMLKKPRLVWTTELHTRFMNAVNHLGVKNAVPKSILQLMNVEGMTRENVASHLQKYRLYLKRLAGLPPNAPLPHDIMQRAQPYHFPSNPAVLSTHGPPPFMPGAMEAAPGAGMGFHPPQQQHAAPSGGTGAQPYSMQRQFQGGMPPHAGGYGGGGDVATGGFGPPFMGYQGTMPIPVPQHQPGNASAFQSLMGGMGMSPSQLEAAGQQQRALGNIGSPQMGNMGRGMDAQAHVAGMQAAAMLGLAPRGMQPQGGNVGMLGSGWPPAPMGAPGMGHPAHPQQQAQQQAQQPQAQQQQGALGTQQLQAQHQLGLGSGISPPAGSMGGFHGWAPPRSGGHNP